MPGPLPRKATPSLVLSTLSRTELDPNAFTSMAMACLERAVLVVQSAMPVAVFNYLMAVRANREPEQAAICPATANPGWSAPFPGCP